MPISIIRYSEGHIPAVREFNRRLREGGAPPDYVFSESHIPPWLPEQGESPVYNEFFLALDRGDVRGAFALKHQVFSFAGSLKHLVYLHHPFSEGIVDKHYSQLGAQMLMRIIRENPLLFALGMGGYSRPLPRMLMALHWKHCLIPYYFRVCNVSKFLREMQVLRTSTMRRLISDVAVMSGLGPLALKSWQSLRGWKALINNYRAELVNEFDSWADTVWAECAGDLAMAAVRDAQTLRVLYPAANRNVTRIRVLKGGQIVGWAVVGILHRPGHKQYGNLRVGTILDVLARPDHATAIIAAATRTLNEQGADLISSNQSHTAWATALSRCGFLKGPSNFIFAAAPAIAQLLEPLSQTMCRVHLNRGDGDNLLQYR